ncbi:hypothetical protein F5I97DRAFT_1827512 [Phlebopus sp. FC_14]|nr:hypothetical protein F5I97DRAFT_1827512 [Phlebopus sp. FC_14]
MQNFRRASVLEAAIDQASCHSSTPFSGDFPDPNYSDRNPGTDNKFLEWNNPNSNRDPDPDLEDGDGSNSDTNEPPNNILLGYEPLFNLARAICQLSRTTSDHVLGGKSLKAKV